MIPSVLSSQVQKGVEDFLKPTFPVATPFFHGVMDRFLEEDGGIFKGPYISIKFPIEQRPLARTFSRAFLFALPLTCIRKWPFGAFPGKSRGLRTIALIFTLIIRTTLLFMT